MHAVLIVSSSSESVMCRIGGYCSRIQIIPYKGALLCLLWVALVWPSFYFSDSLFPHNYKIQIVSFDIYYIVGLSYPLTGWIADVWTGRYKMINFSLYICFIGSILKTIHHILPTGSDIIIYYVGIAVTFVGQSCIYATMLPFIIDQLIITGASGGSLSAYIHWFFFIAYVIGLVQNVIINSCYGPVYHTVKAGMSLVSCILLTIAILSNHVLHKVLHTVPLITNPIKQIASVLNFARKHKYPLNRSALTYWEDRMPSRIEMGKNKYGGPFTEEEVEDVKTVLRMLPLLLCSAIVGIQNDILYWKHLQHPNATTTTITECLLYQKHTLHSLPAVLAIPLYHYLLYPLILYRYNIKMLKSLGAGMLSSLVSVIAYCAIDVAGHVIMDSETSNTSSCFLSNTTHPVTIPISYKWLAIPELFHEIAFIVVLVKSLEFIIAQSPCRMRGFMIGLWYAMYKLSMLIGINLQYIFVAIVPASISPSCLFYYFLIKIIVLATGFVAFMVLSRRYELRIREREINLYQIVESYYNHLLHHRVQMPN